MTVYGSMTKALPLLSRCILGIVFIYASIDKILHPGAFAEVIYNYQILPSILVNGLAILLPWIEALMGLLLIFGIWLPGAVFLCTTLLVIFIGAILLNIFRGLDVECGCFGQPVSSSSGASMTWYVLRDSLFLLPSFYLFYRVILKGGPEKEGIKVLHRTPSLST